MFITDTLSRTFINETKEQISLTLKLTRLATYLYLINNMRAFNKLFKTTWINKLYMQ